MSAAAVSVGKLDAAIHFYDTLIGKKVVMAVTGAILFAYIIGHMLGNLQVFLGAERINAYGAFLHHNAGPLWAIRVVLLVAVILHIVSSIQLALLNRKARPETYARKRNVASTVFSRTMIYSGLMVGAFIIYHLLHFTVGIAAVNPDFQLQAGTNAPDVYNNVVKGFQSIPVSVAYMVAMLLLGMHLYHGAWSMFQSLGVSHPRYTPWLKRFAAVMTVIIVLGFISVPVAVLAGFLPPLPK